MKLTALEKKHLMLFDNNRLYLMPHRVQESLYGKGVMEKRPVFADKETPTYRRITKLGHGILATYAPGLAEGGN